MNRALGHFCAHTGLIGPGERPEDGEMSEMTLPSRHRIRNIYHIFKKKLYWANVAVLLKITKVQIFDIV